MFVYVSNRPSLDLLGTLKWRRDVPEEQLHVPGDLSTWSAGSSLGIEVTAGPAELDQVRQAREALYRVVSAVRAGQAPVAPDVALLNRLAAGPGPRLQLRADGTVSRTSSVEQLLGALVRDALDLLAGPDLARVKDCSNARCTRLYVDVSRASSRRWCGMAECGNVAKVAAFRARQRS
ncbi:ABATE domain-containing protein [Kineosporia sp. J2-2]|uniref:ABATE domain-containing protein n=1 Tax=Kineosporia corallincola TaxID=2835133 RepID=A0ABS5TG77_9ACTN|nr:ABATE domain-containing protein [Kineosporia corallincola]MBT0769379.1 ABATE domain-containing protein [Kineosporia corallincola]